MRNGWNVIKRLRLQDDWVYEDPEERGEEIIGFECDGSY